MISNHLANNTTASSPMLPVTLYSCYNILNSSGNLNRTQLRLNYIKKSIFEWKRLFSLNRKEETAITGTAWGTYVLFIYQHLFEGICQVSPSTVLLLTQINYS